MKRKILAILFMFCLLFSLVFPITKVYAESEYKVTLNFKDGTIHDGYVEYSKKAKLQLFKGEDLVTDISNNMVIDLNEAEYKFVIEEIEDKSVSGANTSIKLKIDNWYYPMTKAEGETKSTFKLDSSKFNGKLDIEFERKNVVFNLTIKNVYEDISSKGVIDLTSGKEHVIDFSKTDELIAGLKSFVDLDKTLYYKRNNKGLLATDNESEAVIKIVGNKSDNKAILTAVNVGIKKSEDFKGFHMQYTGSKYNYDDLDGDIASGGIVRETRYDYYTRCTYDFTFQYVKEEVESKEYKFIEGANQIYIINESNNAAFRIDVDYSLFENNGKVYIDNNLLDNNNYTSKSGSTIISLKDAYLKTLSVGEHILKVTFADGGETTTKFTIKEQQKIEENNKDTEKEEQQENTNKNNNTSLENTESKNNNSNPKTGDNIILYIVIASVAVLGLGTTTIVAKKEKMS